jgi:hypothetical protein
LKSLDISSWVDVQIEKEKEYTFADFLTDLSEGISGSDETFSDTKERLNQSKKTFHSALLTRETTKYQGMCKLPVVPIVHRALKHKKLEELGFQVMSFEGYTVFNDQMLIGINLQYTKKRGYTSESRILELLEIKSEKYGIQLDLVSTEPSIKNGFAYYWALEDSLLSRLVKLTGVLSGWGIML